MKNDFSGGERLTEWTHRSSFADLTLFPELRVLMERAEALWDEEPDYALWRARLFSEKLARALAPQAGISISRSFATQVERLLKAGRIEHSHRVHFDLTRQCGNPAVHHGDGSPEQALGSLKSCWALAALLQPELAGRPYTKPPPGAGVSDDVLRDDLRIAIRAAAARLTIPMRQAGSGRCVRVDEVFEPPLMFVDGKCWSWDDLIGALRSGRRLAVTGAAGAGKTAVARAVVTTLAGESDSPVPILVPARRVVGCSLLQAAVASAGEDLAVPFSEARLTSWLRQGKIFLVLEGLDECGPSDRARLLENLAALGDIGGAGILVTARPAVWSQAGLEGFDECHLAGWDEETMLRYLARIGHLTGRACDAARQLIAQHEALRSLAQLPLLGAFLVEVLLDDSKAPSDATELIDRGLDLIVRRKPAERGHSARAEIGDRLMMLTEELALADARGELETNFQAWSRFLANLLGGDLLLGEEAVGFLVDEAGIAVLWGHEALGFAHAILRDRLAVRAALRKGLDPLDEVLASPGYYPSAYIVALAREATRRDPGFPRCLHTALGARTEAPYPSWSGTVHLRWAPLLAQLVDEGVALEPSLATKILVDVALDCARQARQRDESSSGSMISMATSEHARWLDRAGSVLAHRTLDSLLREGRGEELVGATALALEGYGFGWVRERLVARADLGELEELLPLWPHSWVGMTVVGSEIEHRGDSVGDLIAGRLGVAAAHRVVSGWRGAGWLPAVFAVLSLPSSTGLVEAVAGWVLDLALSAGLPEQALGTLQCDLPRRLDIVVHPGPARAPLLPGLRGHPVDAASGASSGCPPTWMALYSRHEHEDLMRAGTMLPVLPEQWPDCTAMDGAFLRPGPLAGANHFLARYPGLVSESALTFAMALDDEPTVDLMGLHGPLEVALASPGHAAPLIARAPQQPRHIVEIPRLPGQPFLERSVRAADAVAAALLTRGMVPDVRLAHLRQRTTCRSALEAWPALENAIQRWDGHEVAEALACALAYAVGAGTGAWPTHPEHATRMRRVPQHWLARAAWHLCHMEAGKSARRHRGGIIAAMAEGRGHPVAENLWLRLGPAGRGMGGTVRRTR
jgi:hypothetical protein